jgi:NitT/TauT family transport system substrate-binding protein
VPRRPIRFLTALATAAVVGSLLAACGSERLNPAPTPPTSAPSSAAPEPVSVTVGLGYIPSVQFAAFYRADQAGYYAAEGLKVTFQNEIDANLIPKVGQGTVDLGLADGTSVIPAVSQGIPVRYLATIYGQFPSIVFSKAESGIQTPAALKGTRIGIPGKYGSSWVMLQALLASANLTPSDVTIVEYPDFGQAAAVAAGAVASATGFINNEPVQLALGGIKTSVLTVDQITPLPGPGIIASTATIAAKRDAVAGFIRATLKAMNEIVATPSVGLDSSIQAVPDLAKDKATQRAILAATIAAWRPSGVGATDQLTGAIDPADWDASATYMTTLGMVPKPVTSADLVDTSFTSAP